MKAASVTLFRFEVRYRDGMWRVSLDGANTGRFQSKQAAVGSARYMAGLIEKSGDTAELLVVNEEPRRAWVAETASASQV